jgi:branched-chain amino acid transport system substrate-binding protein
MASQSSARTRLAPSVKTGAALSLAALMAACATAPSPGPGIPPAPPGAQVQTREGVTPPFMRGRQVVRVGLLLPFSARPQEATALYNAAEMALFELGGGNTLLIPRDAGVNEATAAATARALIDDGVDIIIGPDLRDGVAGAASAARRENVPVIGFSSDRGVAGDGVYLLSFQLEDEITRLVSHAVRRDIRTMALLAPANEYGRRVESALRAEATRQGVTIVAAQLYSRAGGEAAAAATAMAQTLAANPPQAILLADTGARLRSIASALVAGGIDRSRVRFMGTSVWAWDGEDRVEPQREPSLLGGWYVAADPTLRADFERRYREVFGREATRSASLGYDAVAIASLLTRQSGARGITRGALETNQGFAGSDGLFRFNPAGGIERGLAVIEVGQNTVTVVDAAPRRFPGAGT